MNKRTQNTLINRSAEIHLEIARLNKELESIKDRFKSEDDGIYTGSKTDVAMVVSTRTSTTFSQKIAKSLLTPVQLALCFITKSTKVVTFVEQ